MSKEKRNAALNVTFDGAQFNAPTIIQTGDGATANQEAVTFSPVDMKRIFEFIGKYWPRLASPALSAVGVWGVWNLLVDWTVVALFWLTSSVAIYFVVDALRKRVRPSSESDDSFNPEALSAPALALIVAVLLHDHKTLALNKGKVYFGADRDHPLKTANPQALLDELVAAKALVGPPPLYFVAPLAREHFDALRQLDNRRVFAEASGEVVDLIKHCVQTSLDADIYIPYPSTSPLSPYLILVKDATDPQKSALLLSSPDVFSYCLREGLVPREAPLVDSKLQDADISNAAFVRARLTERGKEIAALLSADV